MWKCPACGRIFKRKNQPHYCGDKPENVDDYIASFDEETRRQLEMVRDAIRSAIPQAQETISWSMPTYRDRHNIIHFAAQKKHIGLYPGPAAVEHFAQELDAGGYSCSKGSIRIPYSDSLPLDLISRIAQWCYQTGNHA